jgi:hypothetical protein
MANVTLWKKAEPVNKLLNDREFAAFEERQAMIFEKLKSTTEPIPPKARQLPAFHEAQVRRFEAKLHATPDAMTQADWHEWMTSEACLAFPDLTPVKAYAKFLATKEGSAMLQQYNDASPAPDVLEPQPQPPKVAKAMQKMDRLASEMVKKGEAPNHAQAIVKVLEKDPSLYTDYLRETT